jgi:endonuclease G
MNKDKRYSFLFYMALCFAIALGSNCFAQQITTSDKSIELPLPLENKSEQILYRKGYTVSYNKDYKIPNWVAWHLTAEHSSGPYHRPTNAWHEDEEVPVPHATIADYKGSGWSRGHMCPAGDNKWDSVAMYESFLFTNCCPQNANLNSGDWNQIEMACRRWAERYGDIYIVCGPILYNKEHETIGPNNIVVPEAFFKVVLCLNDKPKGIGFIRKNTDTANRNDLYVNTISEVESITSMKFFPSLPKEISDSVKLQANLKDWDQELFKQR